VHSLYSAEQRLVQLRQIRCAAVAAPAFNSPSPWNLRPNAPAIRYRHCMPTFSWARATS